MPIHIYNSLTRKKEVFNPLKPAQVKMYVCGPTVYDEPHIGHARSAYVFDVIRRYLKYSGYEVKFVRNVTDVDDKIIDKARKEYPDVDLNVSFKKVAEKYLVSYHEALKDLGIDDSSIIEPRASEYIGKMVSFINALIDKGAAYQSGGDVYFDIKKSKNYGKLSNQSLEKMESGARIVTGENKRDSLDFALWKSAKEGEPSWESPWGKGRPGWHIECSVMSSDILGDTFDIHGGGLDLIFPHHENEIAQSEAAGKGFAKYWIHHGLLTINGLKMAKSLGNFITIKDFITKYKNADLLKLFFLSAHYSHPIDYSEDKIEEIKKAYERIMIMINKVDDIFNEVSNIKKEQIKKEASVNNKFEFIRTNFAESMDNDFNTSRALAILQDLITKTNITITQYPQLSSKEISLQQLFYSRYILLPEFANILGLDLNAALELGKYLDDEVKGLIEKRNEARRNRDFSLADQIRIELEKSGLILEDTKDGATWRRKL